MLEEEAALLTQVFARGARNDSFLVLVTLGRRRQREELSGGSSLFARRSLTDPGSAPQLVSGAPRAHELGGCEPRQPPRAAASPVPVTCHPQTQHPPPSCSSAGARTLVFFNLPRVPDSTINAIVSPVNPLCSWESLIQEKNTP